jgi:hypothetical protein
MRAAATVLSQACHIGQHTLYVLHTGDFKEGDIVSVSSESFRDTCNITFVGEDTLECSNEMHHAYDHGAPVILTPLELETEDATQPTQAPTVGSEPLAVGHAKLTSFHQAGADRLYLDNITDFPDNCIIVLVNPSMQMVGRHLVKPGGSTHRTVEITPVLVRDWPTGTVAAVVSSFTSSTYLQADATPTEDEGTISLTLKVASATVFDVHDVVMVGSDDHAYAERREVTKITVDHTGDYLFLGPSDAETTVGKSYKAGTFVTNAQAQTILIAPAPVGATELQVDTNIFVKAGDEVNIDSGTGYSERATVATSENYMSLVLEKGLLKSYPAGTAVTTLPQEDDDDFTTRLLSS